VSGPVDERDAACQDEDLPGIEVREGRTAEVGGLPIARVLPTKGRRTVGAWCFVDLMGPMDAEDPDPMEVGPHPHIGLSTVTWLLEGEALHTDSLGTEQVIRPGQLNLMTAGHGIAHAEFAANPPFRGAQMWIAQPRETRHDGNAFTHHADLPAVALDGAEASVLMGTFAGTTSPARTDTDLVGTQLTLTGGRIALPINTTHEHAVVPLDGAVRVGDDIVEPGWLALVPCGPEELVVEPSSPGQRMLLIGGVPFPETISMWWNFVGGSREEITDAWRAWRDRDEDRFGPVPSNLERIEAPRPPWLGNGD
jgi:quercetin 2,3-dioxygenase